MEIKNLSKLFGFGDATTVALDDISLNVEKGEFIAIMGPSGSGKSTLLNIIGMLDRPTHGSYVLDGKDVSKLTPNRRAKARRDHIGFVFQMNNLLERLTVIENVALPLAYRGITPVRRNKRASLMLEKVGLRAREFYYPHQLSGGQIQRVAIARALVNKPSIIIADEPTGNLDSAASKKVMEQLSEVHRAGNTIIMVTHNEELTRYATRVIYLFDGQIQYDQALGRFEAVDLDKLLATKPKEKSKKDSELPKRPRKKYKKRKKTKRKASKKTTVKAEGEAKS